jgi:hypothetical protein
MLFRRLIHTPHRDGWLEAAEGYALSIVAHSLLIGSTIVGASHRASLPQAVESFSPVEFLIPKDRLIGLRPKQEHISWTELPATSGAGQAPVPVGDKEALKFVKAKGDSKDEEKSEAPRVEKSESLGDSVMTELQVDSVAVRYEDSAAPPYPESMLKKKIEGTVIVQYVVDTTGHADTSTFSVLFASHREFAASVKNTLPLMRFRPALMGLKKVKQLVQQPFAFRIVDTTQVAREKPRKPEA